MILVQVSDFVGQYQIALSNNNTPMLQSYIDREEKRTFYQVFGQPLGDLLIAYIAGGKSSAIARYDNILNPFYTQNTIFGNYIYARQRDNQSPPFYESSGFKDLLLNTIYYYYITETSGMKSVQTGVANPNIDTATGLSSANIFRFAEQKWNKSGYDTWLAIWYWCFVYQNSTYPEYAGISPKVKYGSLL